jgi:hypothetical protein
MKGINQNWPENRLTTFVVFALIASLVIINVSGQVRKVRWGGGGTARGSAITVEDGNGTAVSRRSEIVKGDEGDAALSQPPASPTPVLVGGTTYWYKDNTYYSRVYSEGSVYYQVVAPPPGAIIPISPQGCVSARLGNVSYQNCGGTYYERVSNGYQVVIIK